MDIYPRMVFVLYDLPPGELRDAAAFLTLSAVWRQMQDTKVVPVSRRKIIVIDEGWSLVEINPRTGRPYFPLAVEYVPEILEDRPALQLRVPHRHRAGHRPPGPGQLLWPREDDD